jgi:hypothetical protein
MRWPWRLHREWDERARQARAEAERSRRALQETREKIVAPAKSFHDHNGFAEIIRDSLFENRNSHLSAARR